MNKEDFVKETTFEFKQGIINHCRKMDKLDVYEWIAEDELKIIQLQQENQKLKEIEKEHQKINGELSEKIVRLESLIDKAIDYVNHPWGFECSDEDCNILTQNRKRFLLEMLRRGKDE